MINTVKTIFKKYFMILADALSDNDETTQLDTEVKNKRKRTSKQLVHQYTVNGEYVDKYESLHDAFRKTKVDPGNISRCASGKRKTAGGYVWRYELNE